MTKREFDKVTKENHGAPMGHRAAYRKARGNTRTGCDDYIARRAAEMRARNTLDLVSLDGYLPTLGIASRFRAVATYRRSARIPML